MAFNSDSDKELSDKQLAEGRRRGMLFWIAAAILLIFGGILALIGAEIGSGLIAFGVFVAMWAFMYTHDL